MILSNTPEHIRKMQCEMIMKLSPQQRGEMAMEMIAMGRMAVKYRLEREYPGISDADLRGEMFRCIYRDKFPPEKMDKIVSSIVLWHKTNPGAAW